MCIYKGGRRVKLNYKRFQIQIINRIIRFLKVRLRGVRRRSLQRDDEPASGVRRQQGQHRKGVQGQQRKGLQGL